MSYESSFWMIGVPWVYYTNFMQRSFEERLGQKIEEMDETQKSRSATIESSLREAHNDMHRMAASLLDIAISIRRVEDKLDRASEKQNAEVGQYTSLQRPGDKAMAGDDKQPLRATLQCAHTNHGERLELGTETDVLETNGADALAEQGVQQQDSVVQSSKGAEDSLDIQHSDQDSAAVKLSRSGSSKELHNYCKDTDALAKLEHEATVGLLQLDTKLAAMDKKLEKITASMGIRSGASMGDDEEDRKRLKEKLKLAIELDKRSRVRKVVSKREVWLEYVFGICIPDKRTGKRGSRCPD